MEPGNYIPTEYLPILLIMIISVVFGAVTLYIGNVFRIKRHYKEKLLAYESGNLPIGEARERFSVKYYIIAMLFVVFDVEAVFLYPWAIVYDKIGLYALVEMILFIFILAIGYIYAWKKEAFDWK
ncbi:MAG TPA: NADH-quinone oxidoreductase subunit A [Nitrospirae bacterium]|nr:NADH-quinone oxidoreductase subunit A [Nitrospirota bacterium]